MSSTGARPFAPGWHLEVIAVKVAAVGGERGADLIFIDDPLKPEEARRKPSGRWPTTGSTTPSIVD